MGNRAQLSLPALVQGFIFSLQAEGKAPSTVSYYQGNLRRFLWYAREQGWPDDPRSIDSWMLREFLAYAGNARNRWGTKGNGSENCREPSKTGGWRYYRTLRALFRWAIAEKLLEHSPLANIKVQPPKEQSPKPYTSEELLKVADALLKPVLHKAEPEKDTYCLIDGVTRYQYLLDISKKEPGDNAGKSE